MARGVYRNQADFRAFDIGYNWRFNMFALPENGGSFVLDGVTYDSRYKLISSVLDGSSMFSGSFIFGSGFDYNTDLSGTNLVAGTVRAVESWVPDVANETSVRDYVITGASFGAVALQAAWDSASLVDDQALLRSIYRGNDTVILSSFADFAFGADGTDILVGNDGADTVFGQAGDDTVRGGYGDDAVFGGAGADALTGGPGRDVLQGGRGGDALIGGAGADLFVFRDGDGMDTITDWTDGVDRIRLYGATDGSAVSIVALSGGHVQISALAMTIVVLNADVADFQLVQGTGFFALI
jgi:Ca2+-binding RTX toxin-like protein